MNSNEVPSRYEYLYSFFSRKIWSSERFENAGAEKCAISEITVAELVFGAEKSNNPEKNHRLIEQLIEIVTVLPIYDSIMKYGKEKARLRNLGKMISDLDLFIGCTAIENDLIMITENIVNLNEFLISNLKTGWIGRCKHPLGILSN